MSRNDDSTMLGFQAPDMRQVTEAVTLVAQVIGVLKTVYDWWASDKSAAHVGASVKALDLLLETRPALRADLAAKARQDPATAQQLRALATDDRPGLVATVKEI